MEAHQLTPHAKLLLFKRQLPYTVHNMALKVPFFVCIQFSQLFSFHSSNSKKRKNRVRVSVIYIIK